MNPEEPFRSPYALSENLVGLALRTSAKSLMISMLSRTSEALARLPIGSRARSQSCRARPVATVS
jgi:hypothetical protein